MKHLFTALAVTMFAGTVSAAGIYQGWEAGNAELYPHDVKMRATVGREMTGVQPGVGDSALTYRGFRNNPDLFSDTEAVGVTQNHPDIYGGFARGNTDL